MSEQRVKGGNRSVQWQFVIETSKRSSPTRVSCSNYQSPSHAVPFHPSIDTLDLPILHHETIPSHPICKSSESESVFAFLPRLDEKNHEREEGVLDSLVFMSFPLPLQLSLQLTQFLIKFLFIRFPHPLMFTLNLPPLTSRQIPR